MLKSYILITLRSVKRNLSYTFLNVFGLSISIMSCLIIFLIVKNELGYDAHHKKADRIYRITLNALDYNPSVSMAIVPAMRTDFPELEQVSQVWPQQSGMVQVGSTKYSEHHYAFADEQYSSIFDHTWVEGNPRTALAEPNTIVLTESIARKYFGKENAMGKVVRLDNSYDLKVTGIIKDPPGNTQFSYIFLVSFNTVRNELKEVMQEFYAIMGGHAYIVIPEKSSIAQLQKKMPGFIRKNWGQDIARGATLLLQPLRDIHFDQRYLNDPGNPTASRSTYWALAIVALFIIVTACINFINLATAQASKRAKEVGVRKTLGANRLQLIKQFLGEAALLVLGAVALGTAGAWAFLPHTVDWLDIRLSAVQLAQPQVIGLLLALTIAIILMAGLYPAFVLSSFRPVTTLKSSIGGHMRGLNLRKSLVFVQFAISQILIVGTLMVDRQMDFFRNQDLGFNKEAVLTFDLPDKTKRAVIEQQLLADPGVKKVSFSSSAPSFTNSFAPFSCPERGFMEDDVTELKGVDERYTDMFEMKMLAGEKIRKTGATDTAKNVVVNEALIHKLGISSPEEAIGVHIMSGEDRLTITGVIQDFQSESKHKLRRPCIMFYNTNRFFTASVKIQPQAMHATIDRIERMWTGLFPDGLFSYEFIDDHIGNMYRQEQKVYTAFRLFSGLAILIGCLGLYGLVAFAAVQRTREVGIRKVLGASLTDIVALFAKEFITLILFAFIVAAPVAYYVMDNWLDEFAYQIKIGGGTFLVAICVSIAIAAITIAYQSLKAALANPLKSLTTE